MIFYGLPPLSYLVSCYRYDTIHGRKVGTGRSEEILTWWLTSAVYLHFCVASFGWYKKLWRIHTFIYPHSLTGVPHDYIRIQTNQNLSIELLVTSITLAYTGTREKSKIHMKKIRDNVYGTGQHKVLVYKYFRVKTFERKNDKHNLDNLQKYE